MDMDEAGNVIANRIINADRELVAKILETLDEMKACMVEATSTNVPSEVSAAFAKYSKVGQANTVMLFQLIGLSGGIGKTPNTNSIRLFDPETGVTMSGSMTVAMVGAKPSER